MHHFHYRNGVLHAEDVNLAHVADAAARPSIAIRPPRSSGTTALFAEAVGAPRGQVFYAMKANSNLAVAAHAGQPRRRRRYGVGRRDPQGHRRRHPGVAHRLLGRRQDRGRNRLRRRSRPLPDQRRKRGRARCARRASPPAATSRQPTRHPHQSRHRRRRPRQDHHRVIRQQVRRQPRRGASASTSRPRTCPASAWSALPCTSAARSRCSTSWKPPSPACAAWRERLKSQGLQRRAPRSRRRPRHSLRGAAEFHARAGPHPGLCRPWSNRTFAGLDVELAFEPGRLIVGNAGILVTRVLYLNSRAGQDLPGGGCGHERSGAPGHVRGLP